MASSSSSRRTSPQPDNLFDTLYNCLLKKDLDAVKEILKEASFDILDKSNRTIINKLAANNHADIIQFIQNHFIIAQEHLIAGYAEANLCTVDSIIEREPDAMLKYELLCFATHGYARANSPKLESYYQQALLAAPSRASHSRAKVQKLTGLLFGKHIDQAFEFINTEIDPQEKFDLLEEAVLSAAILGVNKKVSNTLALFQFLPIELYNLQKKAMLGFSQGNHGDFMSNLLGTVATENRIKIIRISAFGFAKGNHFDKAKAILDKTVDSHERCKIYESIVAGLGKGGLRGKTLSVLAATNTPEERKITLLKIIELYQYEPARSQIEAAKLIYDVIPPEEKSNLHDGILVNELARKGAFTLICEILKNQPNFVTWSDIYSKLDPAMFHAPIFATPEATIVTLAHVNGEMERRLFANEIFIVKVNPAYNAAELLTQSSQLHMLFRQQIITNDADALAWMKLSATQRALLQTAWDNEFISTFKAASAWFRLPQSARILLLQFNPFPRHNNNAHIWLKILSFMTAEAPSEAVGWDLFRDLSFYSYRKLFFAPPGKQPALTSQQSVSVTSRSPTTR